MRHPHHHSFFKVEFPNRWGYQTDPFADEQLVMIQRRVIQWGVIQARVTSQSALRCSQVRAATERVWHREEEFPDNHTGVDYRMDESLPFLAQALSD